ncbi:carboxypeptidase-like regulatory domain-containing protein [Pseudomonas laurylsulfatiphila]|uniref:carboxypeptidase-like regulatory domain-containing protein n=1 Tax=Pseudomonas laurylsulfatiphila TaxID=2011015 RepID=UPI003D227880|nr:hypothetical protein [Pseudomonas reinekei]MDF9905776.1 hypothetical protein [Pseudomonas reinekei]
MTAKPPNTSTLTSDTQSETTEPVTFDAVLDKDGQTVGRNTATYSKTLTFKGTAGRDTDLEIRHNMDQLTTVTSGGSGNWSKLHTLSDFKRYKLVAMELQPDFNYSTPYEIVLASETPIIDKVIGKDGPIDDGDPYTGDSLEFSGFAPPGMEVEAFNDDTTTGKKINVNPDGFFRLTLDGLAAGTYKIKIRAANGKESDVFNFRVVSDVKLILYEVSDSQRVIPEDGSTYDEMVTVRGNAWPGEQVQLLNYDTLIDGATGTAREEDGLWEIELEVSGFNEYRLRAKALYGEGEISEPPYPFSVKEDVKLSLDEVVGSKGPIPDGDTTYDKKVKIYGYARPGRRVQLRNHDKPIGEAITPTDEETGYWEIELEVSAPNEYRLTVEALYGNGEISTPARTFHVALDVKLSLDDVRESEDGPPVDEGGTTDKSPLFITGHALPGESIQLLNSDVPIKDAIATADLVDGVWKFLLDVTDGDYSLTARAEYGDNETTNPPRTFTVESIIQPHNTRVFDSDGLIEDNGTTPYNYVIVRGDAAPLAAIKLQINGVTDLTPEPTDDTGKWAKLVQDLIYGTTYQFIAVADYGDNAESNPWTINPEAPTIVPILDEVTDPEGNKVGGSGGGTTLHTKLTFTGQAKPHGTVEILNGTSRLGEATADEKGDFRKVILGLPETAYNIKIRGLYTGNPESTQHWTFTIEQAVRPTIRRIFDSTNDIDPDGYTYETTVTVEGQAHRLQKVQIFDGDDFLREVSVEGNNTFKAELGGLRFKNYDLRIKPLYGSDLPYSAVHRFSIITKGELSIDNVTDPNGIEIPDGGSVSENKAFTFNGRGAPPNTYVSLYRDNDIFAGRKLAEEDGTFHVNTGSHPLGGPYKFYLKGVDGRASRDWYIRISR